MPPGVCPHASPRLQSESVPTNRRRPTTRLPCPQTPPSPPEPSRLIKPHILLRRVHYWASLPIALPLLLVIATGLLLQFKKSLPWVQPPEQRAESTEPALGLPQILEAAAGVEAAAIDAWNDVYRVEYRPGRNLVKVVSNNRTEIQIDAATGAILQVAPRRSDLIESLHDGSFFGDIAKTWLFTPAAIVLLGLLLTGVYLFFVPILAKRRRRRRDAAH